MRRVPQQYPNPYVRRERDPRAARRQALLLAGCLLLACGFIFAVRQQILAFDYGYKAEALRREREELLDEQRRLLLAVRGEFFAGSSGGGRRASWGCSRCAPRRSSTAAARATRREAGVFVGTASAARRAAPLDEGGFSRAV